jgi:HSP20 family protein
MFSNFWEGSSLEPSRETRAAAFWSQVDVTETDKEIKVCVKIPDVGPAAIDVSVEDGSLIIKGEKKHEPEQNKEHQYQMERSHGAFERTISLPAEMNEAKAKAEFKKDALKSTLPKRPGATSRRRKIPVT